MAMYWSFACLVVGTSLWSRKGEKQKEEKGEDVWSMKPAFFKGYFLSCMYICNKALVYWGFFFFSFPILALSYNFNIYIGKDVLDWI